MRSRAIGPFCLCPHPTSILLRELQGHAVKDSKIRDAAFGKVGLGLFRKCKTSEARHYFKVAHLGAEEGRAGAAEKGADPCGRMKKTLQFHGGRA